jgi:hypothetical protein
MECVYCGVMLDEHEDCPSCDRWEELDDEYDMPPSRPSGDPVNYRMSTLNRVQGQINRHRKAGRLA